MPERKTSVTKSSEIAALFDVVTANSESLAKLLQITENLDRNQDDMADDIEKLVETIHGNGKPGLKTDVAMLTQSVENLQTTVCGLNDRWEENSNWMQAARVYFEDRRQIQFGWKQFIVAGLVQAVLVAVLVGYVQNLKVPQPQPAAASTVRR